jgi:hypothetical protein
VSGISGCVVDEPDDGPLVVASARAPRSRALRGRALVLARVDLNHDSTHAEPAQRECIVLARHHLQVALSQQVEARAIEVIFVTPTK